MTTLKLGEGNCKNNCPWGVSFEQQVIQILTYALGGVGLDIDRFIIQLKCAPPSFYLQKYLV